MHIQFLILFFTDWFCIKNHLRYKYDNTNNLCTSTNNHTCLYGEDSRVGVCEKVLGGWGGGLYRPHPNCSCKIALCFLNSERLNRLLIGK